MKFEHEISSLFIASTRPARDALVAQDNVNNVKLSSTDSGTYFLKNS